MLDVASSLTLQQPARLKRRLCFATFVAICVGAAMGAYSPTRTFWKVHIVVARIRFIKEVTGDREMCCPKTPVDEAVCFLKTPEELLSFIHTAHPQMGSDPRSLVFLLAIESAIWRLEQLGSDEAAECLVRAAADPDISWDIESGESIGESIIKLGPRCVPYLRKYAVGRHADTLREIQGIIEERAGH